MMIEKIKAALISLFVVLLLVSCAAPVQLAQAPAFTLKDLNGQPVSPSDYKGQKAVLLLFFNYKTGGGQDPLLQEYLTIYQGTDKLETLCVINRADLPEAAQQYMAG